MSSPLARGLTRSVCTLARPSSARRCARPTALPSGVTGHRSIAIWLPWDKKRGKFYRPSEGSVVSEARVRHAPIDEA